MHTCGLLKAGGQVHLWPTAYLAAKTQYVLTGRDCEAPTDQRSTADPGLTAPVTGHLLQRSIWHAHAPGLPH